MNWDAHLFIELWSCVIRALAHEPTHALAKADAGSPVFTLWQATSFRRLLETMEQLGQSNQKL